MNTKNIAKIAIVTALVLGAVIAIINKDEQTVKTVKIGAVLPLTGSQAFVGEGLRDAILLAQKQLGDTKYSYEVIFEDSQLDAKASAGAANKLISIDKVDVILDAYAPVGNAISPIAEMNKVVHIGIAFDPKIAEGEYNFLLFTTPDTAARTFLAEMNKRGLHTLGIFRVNNQGILAVYNAVRSLSSEYGISIVSDEGFQPGERDFRNIVTKSATAKADIYALFALPPELEILAKQMNEQNLHNQTSIIYYELTQTKELFEGQWSVGYGQPSDDLEREYRAAYGKELTFGVPNIYDAFNAVVRAAESYSGDGVPSSEYIAHQIQNSPDTEGSLGTLHVNEAGIIDSAVSIKEVRDGKLVIVGE